MCILLWQQSRSGCAEYKLDGVPIITRPHQPLYHRHYLHWSIELVYYYNYYHRNDTITILSLGFRLSAEPTMTTVNRVLYTCICPYHLYTTTSLQRSAVQIAVVVVVISLQPFQWHIKPPPVHAKTSWILRASSSVDHEDQQGYRRPRPHPARVFVHRGCNKRSVVQFP